MDKIKKLLKENKVRKLTAEEYLYLYSLIRRNGDEDFLETYLSEEEIIDSLVVIQKSGNLDKFYKSPSIFTNNYSISCAFWGSDFRHDLLSKMGELNHLRRPTAGEISAILNKRLSIIGEDQRDSVEGRICQSIFIDADMTLDDISDCYPELTLRRENISLSESIALDSSFFDEFIEEETTVYLDLGDSIWDINEDTERTLLFYLIDALRPGDVIDAMFWPDENFGPISLDIVIPYWIDPITGHCIWAKSTN